MGCWRRYQVGQANVMSNLTNHQEPASKSYCRRHTSKKSIHRYKWESAKTLKVIYSVRITKMRNDYDTFGRLLIPVSGTRNVRWNEKNTLAAVTPVARVCQVDPRWTIVWPGVVSGANPWYVVYRFHHQRRGSDLQIQFSEKENIKNMNYLLTLSPPGTVAS